MPTKPADQPEQWATAGVYPASVYPATFPWGDPHPQAGNPTPWSGQPRRNAAGLAGFASTANVPLTPQAADIWNEEFFRVIELSRWTYLGTSAADEDAHPLETDAAGKLNLAQLEVGGNTAAATGLVVNSSVGAGQTVQVNGADEGGVGIICTDAGCLVALNNSAQPTIATINSGAGPDIQTAGPAIIGGVLTPQAGINLGATTSNGVAGSIIAVDIVRPNTVEWTDQGVTIPTVDRSERFNDTAKLVRMSDGVVRSQDIGDRAWVPTFTTAANPYTNTGAFTSTRIQVTEPVWIRYTFDYRHTVAAGGLMTLGLRVTGSISGPADLFIRQIYLDGNLDWLPLSKTTRWVPFADFPAAGTELWMIELLAGSSLAANLELRDIGVEVLSNVRV